MQVRLVYVKNITATSPPRDGEPVGTIVERTNKAEVRPEEQSEKGRVRCQENLWNEIRLKGP